MKKKETVTASSAKSQGNTDYALMEAISEKAFIGIPIYFSSNKNVVSGLYYWVKLDVSNAFEGNNLNSDKVEIHFVELGKTGDESSSLNNLTSTAQKDNKLGDINKNLPDQSSLAVFVSHLYNLAFTLPEFKVRGTVQSTTDNVKIDVGDREGAYLDQGYKIFELKENEKGEQYTDYLGFVRIEEVGKTSEKIDNLSKVFFIKSGNFDVGNIAVSHDQMLDIYLRPSYRFTDVPSQSINWFSQALFGDPNANLLSDDAKTSYNINLSAMFNLAKLTNISQLFVGLDVGVGFLGTTANTGLTSGGSSVAVSVNTPMTLEASLLVHKKIWFAPFSGFAEVQFGINSLKITGKINDKDWELNYGTLNYAAGLNLGLDYAINADMLLGFEAGYRYALPIVEFKIKDTNGSEKTYTKSDNENFWSANKLDGIQLGGLRFGLHFTYMLTKMF
jgi:hypothetical protein